MSKRPIGCKGVLVVMPLPNEWPYHVLKGRSTIRLSRAILPARHWQTMERYGSLFHSGRKRLYYAFDNYWFAYACYVKLVKAEERRYHD